MTVRPPDGIPQATSAPPPCSSSTTRKADAQVRAEKHLIQPETSRSPFVATRLACPPPESARALRAAGFGIRPDVSYQGSGFDPRNYDDPGSKDYLMGIQTPTRTLLDRFATLPKEEREKAIAFYADIEGISEEHTYAVQGNEMVVLPSGRPHFPDQDGVVTHYLCLPKQNSGQSPAQLLRELNDHLENSGADSPGYRVALASARARLIDEQPPMPPNTPHIGEVVDVARRLPQEWLVGQNLAFGSGTCPSHLHLQMVPAEHYPLFKPLLSEEPSCDAELGLSVHGKEIPAQWLLGPGTVLRLEVDALSDEELTLLTQEINALASTGKSAESECGIDVMAHRKADGKVCLYLSFRNKEEGGFHRSFGLSRPLPEGATASQARISEDVSQGPTPALETTFGAHAEPEQTAAAAFAISLQSRLRKL